MQKQETPSLLEVWVDFTTALESLGLQSSFRTEPPDTRWDAVGSIEGVPVVIQLKAAPSIGDVLQLERAASGHPPYAVLAARRVSAAVRDALVARDMGYFDSRGHLRLWRKPLLVDVDVPGLALPPSAWRRLRIETASMLDVALAVLDGLAGTGVRAIAARLGRSPGTVSKHLAKLRAANLVDERSDPTVPDLFDAVLEAWHPQRVPLADLPRPGAGPVNERLQLRLDDVTQPGWVLADSFAAAAWGAPVVLGGDAPPDFYLPDASVLRQARTLLGDAEFGRHACTIAVAPAPYVCRIRHDRRDVFDSPWFAPSPVVAALDLAVDPARGRETLESWSRNPPPEVRRVW
jgi:AcrR family transcriptional regulator